MTLRERVLDRFIDYCQINSGSKEGVDIVPSTPEQMAFAEILQEEACQMGYDAEIIDNVGLRIRVKGNVQGVDPILFGAHLDTSPDAPTENVTVLRHPNYDGKDIKLNGDVVVSATQFTALTQFVGEEILTSDGTTLLGGDDKAGVAALMTFLEHIVEEDFKHGDIDVFFTFDEEIGLEGAAKLDPDKDTNAKYGFTFDGAYGELGTDIFNAYKAYLPLNRTTLDDVVSGTQAKVHITGNPTFPGHGKTEGMIDAFRNVPALATVLEKYDAKVVSVLGSLGGLDVEFVVQDSDALGDLMDELTAIADKRLDPEETPFSLVEEKTVKDVSEVYDLNPLVELIDGIPYEMSAEMTEGRQGYVQPLAIKSTETGVRVRTLLRSFETDESADQRALIEKIAPTAEVELGYRNMIEVLNQHPLVLDIAENAMHAAGVENVVREETRGGNEAGVYTLSAKEMLNVESNSGRQIPSVNVGAFGGGCHSVKEWQPVRALEVAVQTAINIAGAFVERAYRS